MPNYCYEKKLSPTHDFTTFYPIPVKAQERNELVLFRGTTPDAKQVTAYIIPWLEHLGVPFQSIDLDIEKLR
jgi:hypothetical protein